MGFFIVLALVGCKRAEETQNGQNGSQTANQGGNVNPVPPSSDVQKLSGPAKVAGTFLKALQDGQLATAVDQMSQWNTSQNAIYSALLDNNVLAEALYGKLQFTVGNTQMQGNTAVVNLKLSNVHLAKGLASKWTSAVAQNIGDVIAGRTSPEQVLQEIVTDASKDTKLERFDYTGKLNLKKEGNTWKVQPDSDLLNTITADLLKPIQTFLGQFSPKNP
ncbi:hypothetical protein DC3_32070 [Deinococcus cellulosilyticus NBRC 106333 = KACC 11606]|uniref:Uncharacterized protein n=2 Tax=Deinococcus cellulosilyticus TaxID=401558 RepID=A0A511N402_DEIC1|nr:hypothetical protein DC3_32070 [Deinococcus cellulosilyticus NBRC 106333 = KACC 11606]